MVVIILCFFFVFGNCFVANSASEEVICEKNDTLIIETEMQEYQEVYELYFKSMNKCFLIFKLETQDGSSIEFGKKISDGKRKIDCFVIYNGSADGNQFLLFDYQSKIAYITDIIFANFYPIISSMDESKLQILLVNHDIEQMNATDTLRITDEYKYIPYNIKYRVVKCPLRILQRVNIN